MVIRTKEPLEILISAALALVGMANLAFGVTPGSVAELLPGWFRWLWLGMITLGGILVLIGVYWRKPLDGLFIEQIGLSMVGFPAVIYGLGLIYVHPAAKGVSSGAVAILIGAAYLWKRQQVWSELKGLPTK